MAGKPYPLDKLKEEKFTRLRVIEELESKYFECKGQKVRKRYFLCLCDCGNTIVSTISKLRKGDTKSCGCLGVEYVESLKKYGKYSDKKYKKEYRSWAGMFERCYDSKNSHYKDYGGRGIIVCDRWSGEDGFINFMEDMGQKPGLNYSIERENVNGNYEPSNCRWATDKEQGRNKRTNRVLEYKGKEKCLKEWSELLDIHYDCLRFRLDNGWPVQEAFETPSIKGRNQYSAR